MTPEERQKRLEQFHQTWQDLYQMGDTKGAIAAFKGYSELKKLQSPAEVLEQEKKRGLA